MCGRYYIEIEDPILREIVTQAENNTRKFEVVKQEGIRTGEVFPTNIAPALIAGRTPTAMRWGFARFDGKGHIINARSETAHIKRMFQKSMLEARCLLPASGYYEWQKPSRQKYAFHRQGCKPLYLAGIYRRERGVELPTFVILTRDADKSLSHIHNRMPVIIPESHMDAWLDESPKAMECAMEVLEVEAV